MEAPAKKLSRTIYSGAPQHQQQQQQPSTGKSQPSKFIDYEALMRRQEAHLSRFRKGSNAYKVEVGKIRAECGRMAAEATMKEKKEKKDGDLRNEIEARKMKKRVEIEEKKEKEDKEIEAQREKEEDARNERIKRNLERVMNVVGEENRVVKEKAEKEVIEAQRRMEESEARMEARRRIEDSERQTQYLRDIEGLPPLEPLEEFVEDEQVAGTSSGNRGNFSRTIHRAESWERDESDEWDEDAWTKTVSSIASRPEFGEEKGEKGKGGGGRAFKKGEAVTFGQAMNEKEHELLDARIEIVKKVSDGLERAKVGAVEPEDKEYFEELEGCMQRLEEKRAGINMPKIWGRAGLSPAGEKEEERKDERGRRKEKKRDSKEKESRRHRERRESRDREERRYRERKGSEEKRKRSGRRSPSRSDV